MIIKKKSRKADLERKRFAFFQIGLILAGALCLAAFEFITPVIGAVEKQNWNQDSILTFPDIPIELTARAQPKTTKARPIANEVKLVVKLTPSTISPTATVPSTIKLGQLDNILGTDSIGPIIQTINYIEDDPEKWPKFPGNMGEWIGKNIALPEFIYPTTGTVYVNFIVSKTGEITNVKISKSLDPEHDKAALEVVKKMPNWTPGEQFGKPVAVNYHLPIRIVNQ